MSKRELPTPGGSPFLFALCLPLRSPRSGVVPLHGFLYGPAHKGVYRLSTGLRVGFDNIFLAFGHSNPDFVSLDLETNQCTIRVSAGDPDPGGVVQRAMEEVRRRGWD